jgi:NADP-dependent 3-hydroxy acid dehydrogenase YdfG
MSTDQHTGRVAVVTGASSGIGEATARALAADGHRVALLARRGHRIQTLADELGDGAIAVEADVTDRESVVAAADCVTRQRRPRWASPRRTSPTSSPLPSAGHSA